MAICLLISGIGAYAQSVSVQWLKNSDGASWDLVSDMVMDSSNNIYVAGNYTSTAIKDLKTTEGHKDIFLAKYNSEGEQEWFQSIKSKDYCHINSLELDHEGQLLISGFFNKELRLGEFSLNAERGNHAFFAVLDEDGNFKLAKHINGYFKGLPIFVKAKSEGGYWFVGSYTRDLIIDEETFDGNYSSEIFIGSFDKKGELEDYLLLTGNGDDIVNNVVTHSDDQLWLTGSFVENLLIGNLQLLSKGYTDAFLLGLNHDLEVIEIKQIGAHYKDYGQAMHFDAANNLIWTGCFSSEIILDAENTLESKGNHDVFLAKYNVDHDLIWTQQLGGKANDYVMSVASNKNNSIYINGSFRGAIEKEDQEIESKDFSSDVFLAKFDKEGQFKYMEALGDEHADYARQLTIDSENYIYLSGNFNKRFKAIEDTTTNADGEDFFLTQLYDCEFSKPIKLPSDTALCGKSFEILADSGYVEYIWNKQNGDQTYQADSTSMYYLLTKDAFKCISEDSIFIQLNDDPIVDLGSDIIAYQGDIIYLTANPGMETYEWNDKSQLSFIEIQTENLKPGKHHYSVTVSDSNFCQGSGEINIQVLKASGLDEAADSDAELSLEVYPNPAKYQTWVQLKHVSTEEKLQVECYSLDGALLWHLEPDLLHSNMELELNLQEWVPGTYILMVKNGAASLDEMFVVVK